MLLAAAPLTAALAAPALPAWELPPAERAMVRAGGLYRSGMATSAAGAALGFGGLIGAGGYEVATGDCNFRGRCTHWILAGAAGLAGYAAVEVGAALSLGATWREHRLAVELGAPLEGRRNAVAAGWGFWCGGTALPIVGPVFLPVSISLAHVQHGVNATWQQPMAGVRGTF